MVNCVPNACSSTSKRTLTYTSDEEIYTAYRVNQYRRSPTSPLSPLTRDTLDAQVRGEQARAQDAQFMANTHRLNEMLRIDKRRVDALYRTKMEHISAEMEQMAEEMQSINWDVGD